uniref:WLM domain-containing protein n=1 Tax=Oryza barthii TaxID=65489 RepID=A0A0D3GDP4_9ORYZ
MEVGDLHKVWEIRALKRKPDEPAARALLDRVAKQVQPIMRRRKWRVKVLSEFSPKNPRLLGLNVGGGVEVKLRLRHVGRDYDFIPYEEVLDTMLHELCHIARGPHDAQFYKLWDELRKECEELVSKGITGSGQGFDGTGRRLGGFTVHPPPPSLRQATLAAAQKRARNGALLPSGPRKLGGNNDIMSALSPIQAAAMAAERRMYDDLWCGSHDQSGIDDSEDVVILEDTPNLPTQLGKSTKDGFSSSSENPSTSSGFPTAAQNGSSSCRITIDAGDSSLWECVACTLLNQPLAPICEVCSAAKPKTTKAKYATWSCKFCTLENSTKIDKCSACDQWRYSHGPPAATYCPSYD